MTAVLTSTVYRRALAESERIATAGLRTHRSDRVAAFVAERDDQAERDIAVGTCAGCPVITLCGLAAEAHGERFGVWGGVGQTRRPGKVLKAVQDTCR
jgi:hypothetical protein